MTSKKPERRSLSRRVFQFFLVVRVPDYKKPRKEFPPIIRSWEVGHTDGEKVTNL